jgi:hypothetical protein
MQGLICRHDTLDFKSPRDDRVLSESRCALIKHVPQLKEP